MSSQHSQILTLLADGRIDAEEAERLLAVTAHRAGFREQLLTWLPTAGVAALLVEQHFDRLRATLDFLTLRAAEIGMLGHFYTLFTR